MNEEGQGSLSNVDAIVGQLKQAVIEYGPRVVAALAILIIGWILAKIAVGIFKGALKRAKVDATLASFLGNIVNIALLALVVISALGKLGVNTASFAAIIAAAGLAIGFALQGSLGNFASGVMLILFRPFQQGDFVEAGGVSGSVMEVDVFATKLKTPDNKLIIVGNSQIVGGSITNYSAMDTRRVDLVFGIGYDDDIKKAKSILERLLEEDSRVLKDPAWTVAVSELADSSVNFVVRPWVKKEDYWGVYFDLTERVKLEFDSQGISIPFPQTDVHLHQAAAG